MLRRRRIPYMAKNFNNKHIAVFIILVVCINKTLANWWLLGLQGYPPNGFSSSVSHKENCHNLHYLDEKQKQLCSLGDKILAAVSSGAKLAIEECQHQFRMNRWNCTTYDNTSSIFGGVVSVNSRETAFIHAITAAGVAYAITRACSRGELNECSCDTRPKHRQSKNSWQWRGCSEDTRYGQKFSREFVDSQENLDTAIGLMNQHNNDVGRKIIRMKMQKVCKCHGMSGSCNVQVCWRKLPSFREVGDSLIARYERTVLVKMVEKKRRHIKKLQAVGKDIKQPNRTELVYLEESLDYCERNESLGIMGTKGRLCNQGSLGLDGCSLLCCGRGYQIRIREVEEKCRCKFVWCCNVVCETCRFKKEEYVCN